MAVMTSRILETKKRPHHYNLFTRPRDSMLLLSSESILGILGSLSIWATSSGPQAYWLWLFCFWLSRVETRIGRENEFFLEIRRYGCPI